MKHYRDQLGLSRFCVNRVYVILGVVLVIIGGLLITGFASGATASESTTQTAAVDEAVAVYKDYDWGWTKANGSQVAEDQHRDHLDEQFKVYLYNQGDTIGVMVTLPDPLLRRSRWTWDRVVKYSLDQVFYKWVSSQESCDHEQNNGSILLLKAGQAVYKPGALEWLNEHVSPIYYDYEVEYGAGQRRVHFYITPVYRQPQYLCLGVKLKGDNPRAYDTHPEWAFVSARPLVNEIAVNWPGVNVLSSSLATIAYNSVEGFNFDFKHRVIKGSEICNQTVFAIDQPGVYSSIQDSGYFIVPDTQWAEVYFQNHYVCFQATITSRQGNIYHHEDEQITLYRSGHLQAPLGN